MSTNIFPPINSNHTCIPDKIPQNVFLKINNVRALTLTVNLTPKAKPKRSPNPKPNPYNVYNPYDTTF